MTTLEKHPQVTSRRGLLAAVYGGVGSAVAAPVLGSAQTAQAAVLRPGYSAGAYDTATPDLATRHLLSRFSSGVTPALVADANSAGGPPSWFEQQLAPNSISDGYARGIYGWFPNLDLSPSRLWELTHTGQLGGMQVMQDLVRWTMLVRLFSNRQVLESMVEFWQNLVHVCGPSGASWIFRTDYQKMIRDQALGAYSDILFSAITHPAMGIYLDNASSTADDLNENLGREVLECHSVGLGFTEEDVIDSARILTGWRVDRSSWKAIYQPGDHWTGPVQVLGFQDQNSNPDGRAVTARYLTYLANHPATAQRVCRRLAVRFVSDNPSQALVDELATVYISSSTAIIPVLRALIASQEFKGSIGLKIRTPVEDVIASWRVLQVRIAKPTSSADAANQILAASKLIGQQMFLWRPPNGFPDSGVDWAGACRVLASCRQHWLAASAIWPGSGITFKPILSWVPRLPIRYDRLVDHLSRTLLATPSTDVLLQAACLSTSTAAEEVITADHHLVTIDWKLPALLLCLLDSPKHLTR